MGNEDNNDDDEDEDDDTMMMMMMMIDPPSRTEDNQHRCRPYPIDHHTPHSHPGDTPGSTHTRQGQCALYCSSQEVEDRNDILHTMVAHHHLAWTPPGAHPLEHLQPEKERCLRSMAGRRESC